MAANVLSNTLGSISIACWIVVYLPQYFENYVRQSAEGLSALFVCIWLLGDFANLLDACLARLLPTIIILAFYYTACDFALLLQIYYYRWKRCRVQQLAEADSESAPLLEDYTSPKSRTRNLARIKRGSLVHLVSIALVISTGAIAWLTSRINGVPWDEGSHYPESLEVPVQVLGWSSTSLYLGARIPQIIKNVKTRSEGLSPALFLWAILGNATYTLSICAAASTSTDPRFWVTNSSWLIGSSLALCLDVIILLQMAYYRSWKTPTKIRSVAALRETEDSTSIAA